MWMFNEHYELVLSTSVSWLCIDEKRFSMCPIIEAYFSYWLCFSEGVMMQ